MNEKLKITVLGIPINSFVEDLSLINEQNCVFSDLVCPDNTDEGLLPSPEAATIIASVVCGLSSLVSLLIYYLEKREKQYTVVIIDSKGKKIEFGKGTTLEMINSDKDDLDRIDIERIIVRSPPLNFLRKV